MADLIKFTVHEDVKKSDAAQDDKPRLVDMPKEHKASAAEVYAATWRETLEIALAARGSAVAKAHMLVSFDRSFFDNYLAPDGLNVDECRTLIAQSLIDLARMNEATPLQLWENLISDSGHYSIED